MTVDWKCSFPRFDFCLYIFLCNVTRNITERANGITLSVFTKVYCYFFQLLYVRIDFPRNCKHIAFNFLSLFVTHDHVYARKPEHFPNKSTLASRHSTHMGTGNLQRKTRESSERCTFFSFRTGVLPFDRLFHVSPVIDDSIPSVTLHLSCGDCWEKGGEGLFLLFDYARDNWRFSLFFLTVGPLISKPCAKFFQREKRKNK